MRFVRISQEEFDSIRRLYEGVMSSACHGLFYREGNAVGEEIATVASRSDDFFDTARKVLLGRGWVETVLFDADEVKVQSSIEVSMGSQAPTCHRLRGILSRLYEVHLKRRVRFEEVHCASQGHDGCVFKIAEE